MTNPANIKAGSKALLDRLEATLRLAALCTDCRFTLSHIERKQRRVANWRRWFDDAPTPATCRELIGMLGPNGMEPGVDALLKQARTIGFQERSVAA